MKKLIFILVMTFILVVNGKAQNSNSETIEISGKVTDFDGNPIDSAAVKLIHPDFSKAYSTYSDSNGNYTLSDVKKGTYMAMYVIRPNEYPRKTVRDKSSWRKYRI